MRTYCVIWTCGGTCGRLAALCACVTALAWGADPALTIYNQNFAVIRETLPLDLKAGNNTVRFSGATAHVEPDSVILRAPAGRRVVQVVEQNYRNDAVSQERLLNLYEGKTIEFAMRNQDGSTSIVTGKIVRSGYVPHYEAMNRYGMQYQANQMAMAAPAGGTGQPIIEVGGKLQFSLPGQPIFPALADDTILIPAFDWILYSAQPAKFDAELSYVSGGMSWSSDYNIVAPEAGDTLELVGWVTLDNQSGKQFDHAHIKLMAGDVNKVQPQNQPMTMSMNGAGIGSGMVPQVEEKTFEDYHLYTLPLTTTIHDRETKQVEFLHANGIQSKRLYVYDGARFDRNYGGYQDARQLQQYGTQSNPHVWVLREFANSDANHLGIPLPKGRVRFYRRDQDGQMEFTGENEIDHTALRSRRLLKQLFDSAVSQLPESCQEFVRDITNPKHRGLRRALEQKLAAVIQDNGIPLKCACKDASNLVIVNSFTLKSVRVQSRDDEGPILVRKGDEKTTFEEASDLFRSIDEKMVRPQFAIYAPVEYNNPAERRSMQVKLRDPILRCLDEFGNGAMKC